MIGIAYPAVRSRRTTSWVATAMATATTGTQPNGANTRMAMTPNPRNAPTPIAAGRLRPARPAFFVGSDESAPPTGAVSVSATVLLLKVWSPVT